MAVHPSDVTTPPVLVIDKGISTLTLVPPIIVMVPPVNVIVPPV